MVMNVSQIEWYNKQDALDDILLKMKMYNITLDEIINEYNKE